MSIGSFLKRHAGGGFSRWHTPGHKGTLDARDITELADGSFPADSVLKAQKAAADFYGTRDLRFLTGGSSMGIKAAILAADGDILAADTCHRAVEEGCRLAQVRLFRIPTGEGADGLPNLPTPAGVQAALNARPSVKAVYLESPNYFGFTLDPAIPKLIKAAGKLFFCDAAHGAHFAAHPGLFPVCYGKTADACNLSAHKTLDAYTQSAYLCVNHDALTDKIDDALRLLGTTSPSYLLLASLESAARTAQKNAAAYERLYAAAAEFKKRVRCVKNDDFTRLVVRMTDYGTDVKRRLAAANISAELYHGDYAVFIATPHERRADFDRLADAVLGEN
jgi:arginine/lysine/ornithine decarboxylase